ncbi:hypothetical protein NC653_023063 [Populus alba x Populus x berolinensis]|uniref:Uncharacterized protein n=1 Tax=Populus alba x Populus x berolinensis TaxID=444605 RepID=A0AAD6QCE2_9ROSI|nr:hypothetical protein NC653_023063 [Populus alba x Populus x berolinensis]
MRWMGIGSAHPFQRIIICSDGLSFLWSSVSLKSISVMRTKNPISQAEEKFEILKTGRGTLMTGLVKPFCCALSYVRAPCLQYEAH